MSSIRLLDRSEADTAATPRVIGLVCRACGHTAPLQATNMCEECFGPLEVQYDYEEVARRVSRESIAAGPASIWRYRALLPIESDDVEPISLGEGWTPLIHARNLGDELGLRNLYVKNDTLNPTGSFKDRVVSVALTWARDQGFTTVACASTGNLANSVAAYAARAGLRAVVLVPAGIEPGKIAATTVYRPTLVRINGSYDDVNRLCTELIDTVDWAFCNINLRPFYSEGSKTLTFETVEQLGWRLPDEIVVPVASGCQFVKHDKAIRELIDVGLVAGSPRPRLTGAQAAGCGPVATAFAGGEDAVTPVRPSTIAHSIAIGNPSDGADVLRIARGSGGVVESVTEEEIVEGIELLAATEGLFAEAAGGVTVAVLRKLARAGRWQPDATVVAYITGHGLKTVDALAGRVALADPIAPSLRTFVAEHADLIG